LPDLYFLVVNRYS